MSTTEDQDVQSAPPPKAMLTWRRLAIRAAVAIPVLFIILMAVFRFVDPFLLVFCVVFGGLAFWAAKGSRASIITLGVIAVIFLVMNAPFIVPSLMSPASVIDFLLTAFLLLATLTIIISSFKAARPDDDSPNGPRIATRVVGALGVVAILVAVVARVTYDGGTQQSGDIALELVDVEFEPGTIESDGGTVSVFLTNNDPTLHTFTIDELDVDIAIPQNATARIEFEAEPGEYRFYCTPHESVMEGTLEVR